MRGFVGGAANAVAKQPKLSGLSPFQLGNRSGQDAQSDVG